MTKNYILRNNLLNNSVKNLEILKNQIRIKVFNRFIVFIGRRVDKIEEDFSRG
jgi:hypothetical protein